MSLDPQVVAALVDLRVCELRLLAAWTFVQRETREGCLPPVPPPARRRPRSLPRWPIRREPGGGGHSSS
jgi:hypothetical protein